MFYTTARPHATHVHRLPVRADQAIKVKRVPTHEEIARLAYSYWEAGGRGEGTALWDWLRAERDLGGR